MYAYYKQYKYCINTCTPAKALNYVPQLMLQCFPRVSQQCQEVKGLHGTQLFAYALRLSSELITRYAHCVHPSSISLPPLYISFIYLIFMVQQLNSALTKR